MWKGKASSRYQRRRSEKKPASTHVEVGLRIYSCHTVLNSEDSCSPQQLEQKQSICVGSFCTFAIEIHCLWGPQCLSNSVQCAQMAQRGIFLSWIPSNSGLFHEYVFIPHIIYTTLHAQTLLPWAMRSFWVTVLMSSKRNPCRLLVSLPYLLHLQIYKFKHWMQVESMWSCSQSMNQSNTVYLYLLFNKKSSQWFTTSVTF